MNFKISQILQCSNDTQIIFLSCSQIPNARLLSSQRTFMCALTLNTMQEKSRAFFYGREDSLQTKASTAHHHNHHPEKVIAKHYM